MYFCDVDSSTNNAKVGTLPEGWRYGEYIAAPAYLGGASGIYVDINANGEVGYRNNSRSGILYDNDAAKVVGYVDLETS